MSLVTIVPVKALRSGKSRLAGALDAHERERLCRWMLERTIGLAPTDADLIVVTEDEDVAATARIRRGDVQVIRPDVPGDLNAALSQARSAVPAGRSVLVMPTDLVLLDADALEAFLAPGGFAIAPDLAGQGTNLLHLPPKAVAPFQFSYGANSFNHHVRSAARTGHVPRVHRASATAVDIDLPGDLAAAGLSTTLKRSRI